MFIDINLFGSMGDRMSSIFATDLILKNAKLTLVMVYRSFIVSQKYSSEYSYAHNFIHIGSLFYKLVFFQMIHKCSVQADTQTCEEVTSAHL